MENCGDPDCQQGNLYFKANDLIYFLRQGNLVKIGITYRLPERLEQLKCEFGAFDLVYLMRGGQPLENQLHSHFRQYRINRGSSREWYREEGELKDFLSRHKLNPGQIEQKLMDWEDETAIAAQYRSKLTRQLIPRTASVSPLKP